MREFSIKRDKVPEYEITFRVNRFMFVLRMNVKEKWPMWLPCLSIRIAKGNNYFFLGWLHFRLSTRNNFTRFVILSPNKQWI